MSTKLTSSWLFLLAQVGVIVVTAVALAHQQRELSQRSSIEFPRQTALRLEPLYDFPDMITDDDMLTAAIKIAPRFGTPKLRPNFLEHALRIWGVGSTFPNTEMTSGAEMFEFLSHHSRFAAGWGKETAPLLMPGPLGATLRVVGTGGLHGDSASRHHDHTLACLSEAGVALDSEFEAPNGKITTMEQAVRQAIDDFRVDERETEWSAMLFALWLPPRTSWLNGEGREVSFDLLAKRLLRGPNIIGVCNGTHRLYTLNLLLRINATTPILSPAVRDEVHSHLKDIVKIITESQHPDGYWTELWHAGEAALPSAPGADLYRKILVTGHQLEWLAFATPELQPPHDSVVRAGRWLAKTMREVSPQMILTYYTFSTHAASSLALWRKQRLPDLLKISKVQAGLAEKRPPVATLDDDDGSPSTPSTGTGETSDGAKPSPKKTPSKPAVTP